MPIVRSDEKRGLPPLIAGVDVRSPLEQQVEDLQTPLRNRTRRRRVRIGRRAAAAARTPVIAIAVIVRRAGSVKRGVQVILELTIHPRLLAQAHLDGFGVPLLDRALEIQLRILRIDLDRTALDGDARAHH